MDKFIEFAKIFLVIVNAFFVIYLVIYSTYLFLSSVVGSCILFKHKNYRKLSNRLKHDYYVPVSILVPAYNEELTVVETVKSLLELDYKLYEIIVIDDGSKDNTSKELIDYFKLKKVSRPIRKQVTCKEIKEVYETNQYKVKITLLKKVNGGKADALNAGINASEYPYFTSMDADSMLQHDSLENIVRPILSDDRVVACGGIVRIANDLKLENGKVNEYHLPKSILTSMQVLEYDRSFLASRILFDQFNGNLIISGAFGLFKKDIAIAAGGYDVDTVGEDFELVIKLHVFCKMHKIDYLIKYIPEAICWSQAPSTVKDLIKQRRRWNKGLLQGMSKYKELFLNPKYGLVSFISFLYFLIYELLSPFIEIFGLLTMLLAFYLDLLNIRFMLMFMFIYVIFGGILSLSTFLSRLHIENIKLSFSDLVKATILCVFEITVLRYIILIARFSSFIGYKKKRNEWDRVERTKMEFKSEKFS